jgi:ergothioneine biosynthesis protein EgtB
MRAHLVPERMPARHVFDMHNDVASAVPSDMSHDMSSDMSTTVWSDDPATRYASVRQRSLKLAGPLSDEDCAAQSMTDTSPLKWHLAHTTWFFETFLLEPMEVGFQPFHPSFRVLFNSYYNGIGEKHPRAQRGLLTRPSMAQVRAYRADVDRRMALLLGTVLNTASDAESFYGKVVPASTLPKLWTLLTLGLQHEQQHQELMLTDIKHLLAQSALWPAYHDAPLTPVTPLTKVAAQVAAELPPEMASAPWVSFDGGLVDIGFDGAGFCFDNELPRHREYVAPFALATRLVTNREFLDFINAGGYGNAALWLAEGWDWVRSSHLTCPLYWKMDHEGQWCEFTLQGLQRLDLERPVCHLSLFEANAYANWMDARLPTEAEWEYAAQQSPDTVGHAAQDGVAAHLHPGGHGDERNDDDGDEGEEGDEGDRAGRLAQMVGHCWQWTSSSYAPYPGYRAAAGALGEYNGKFMLNQYVLRGSSCATPPGHARASYRNFFPAGARWQFTGIRLAR